jgi:hypothetical protein
MRMVLYLAIALIPIAMVYSRFLDGSKLKDFFIAISYLSMMAWAFFFALILEMFLRVPLKYSVAVLAIVMAYLHYRTIVALHKRRRQD